MGITREQITVPVQKALAPHGHVPRSSLYDTFLLDICFGKSGRFGSHLGDHEICSDAGSTDIRRDSSTGVRHFPSDGHPLSACR